jgi:peptidyl-prolyl cis-trans isomerase A (cyclophilin A)
MTRRPTALLLLLALGCGGAAGPAGAPSAVIGNDGNRGNVSGQVLTFDLARADQRVTPPAAGDLDRYLAAATPAGRGDALIATISTSLGDLDCTLDTEDRPITVANFLGLATGLKAWTDPELGDTIVGVPFYDGTIFHRVIRGFMIQGGDRLGTGRGSAGYRFADETSPSRDNVRSTLAMANSGPNTNGSQFFINHATNEHLDGKHTVFGACEPFDVIDALAEVETSSNGRPLEPVFLLGITFRWR